LKRLELTNKKKRIVRRLLDQKDPPTYKQIQAIVKEKVGQSVSPGIIAQVKKDMTSDCRESEAEYDLVNAALLEGEDVTKAFQGLLRRVYRSMLEQGIREVYVFETGEVRIKTEVTIHLETP
jgi:hypothetical protein